MTEEQLKEAIHEYDYGNKIIARQILLDTITNEPDNEEAWLLLSVYSETAEQKIYALRRALAINPNNLATAEMLKQYGLGEKPVVYDKSIFEVFAPSKKIYGPARNEISFFNPPGNISPSGRGQAGNPFLKGKEGENRRYRLGIGLLAGVILLWGIFFGLLIKGPSPRYILVTGKNPTDSAALALASPSPSSTPAATPVPSLTPSPTSTPTVTPVPSPTPSPTPPEADGSRANPVKPGSGYRFLKFGSMKVENSTWLPGQTGPIVVDLAFVCEKPADEICATEVFTFELVTRSGNVYRRSDSASTPKPRFGNIINRPTYGGTIEQGYAGFMVSSPETGLLLRVTNALEPGNRVYFQLP